VDALGQPTAAPGRHVGPRGAGGRFPYRTVHQHARHLKDIARLADYERALRAAVKPGDRVLDLGAGHVAVLDTGPMLEVARARQQANGRFSQATFVPQPRRGAAARGAATALAGVAHGTRGPVGVRSAT
jgi:hypothetical protein